MQAQAASERGSQADVVQAAEQLQVWHASFVTSKHAYCRSSKHMLKHWALQCLLHDVTLCMWQSISALPSKGIRSSFKVPSRSTYNCQDSFICDEVHPQLLYNMAERLPLILHSATTRSVPCNQNTVVKLRFCSLAIMTEHATIVRVRAECWCRLLLMS